MSLPERQAQRQRYRDRALEQAEQMGLTMRCQGAIALGSEEEHRRCRGESPGGAGCLCTCHDNPGVVVLARSDEPAAAR